jgi:hypothetical protein
MNLKSLSHSNLSSYDSRYSKTTMESRIHSKTVQAALLTQHYIDVLTSVESLQKIS